jgi:hypothetical protein
LGLEISAIDAFAPMARISLEHILGPSPPIRTLGKSKLNLTQEQLVQAAQQKAEEAAIAIAEASAQEVSEAANNNNNKRRSSSSSTTSSSSSSKSIEEFEKKDNGMWSPSRILTIMPTDSEAFELVKTNCITYICLYIYISSVLQYDTMQSFMPPTSLFERFYFYFYFYSYFYSYLFFKFRWKLLCIGVSRTLTHVTTF